MPGEVMLSGHFPEGVVLTIKKILLICVAVITFFIALGILLYPLISTWYNQRHQSEIQTQYQQMLEQMDDTQILNARDHAHAYNNTMTDLVDLLRRNGETLKRSGSEYQWGEGSNKVTVRGNTWYHQYEQRGGDAIDFVRKFYNKSFPEAVEYLLGQSGGVIVTVPLQPRQPKEEKVFALPPRNDNMRRVYAYLLHHRKLDRDVVNAFAHRNLIYESADTHNVVFVGCDRSGIPRHAQKRSTASQGSYKGNVTASQMEHAFHWHGRSENLFLFEAPIDMLSFISMTKDGWQQHSYAAACSVTDKVLFQMMKDNPNIKYVFVCFDNDDAGQSAAQKLCDKLTSMGIPSSILTPGLKDWNEDLVQSFEETEEACMHQAM